VNGLDGDAAAMVARALSRRAPRIGRGSCGSCWRTPGAGLVVIEGERAAGEAVYRLADALVARGRR